MTQTSHTAASDGGTNPIAAGSFIAAVLLLAAIAADRRARR